jgi:hypothetical protein
MLQDFADHHRIFDTSNNPDCPAATTAKSDVDIKDSL